MSAPTPNDRSRSYAAGTPQRRRFSPWTIIAPVAVLILWVSFFQALGKSCFIRSCPKETTKTQTTKTGNDYKSGAKVKIKVGDSIGALAARYHLTEDELTGCNPSLDPQALQPGTYIRVSSLDCKDADKAAAGANPDPLAGDTTAGTEVQNGTAAADPSAQKQATSPTSTDSTK